MNPETSRHHIRQAVLLVCASIVAGCGGPPKNAYFAPETAVSAPIQAAPPQEPPPEMVPLTNSVAPMVGLDVLDSPNTRTNGAQTNVVITNAVAAAATPVISKWGPGWVPLEKFAAECGISPPQRTIIANSSRYTIATRNGPLFLTIGTQLAKWNGINVWLGFAPQVLRGKPYVHALDIEKTLEPLSETFSIRAPTKTIVIDPGHGGVDAGTRGVRGEREKDFTLDWALRTERLLTNAGWRVVLTRRTDMDVPLTERVSIADRARADLFVSLHFNSAAPHPGPSGIQTYYLTPTGEPSTLSRGFADDPRLTFPNNAFDRANTQLAARLHHQLITETRALDDGIRHARFMAVLRNQSRPAVLIEGGYLSNPAEMTKISSAAYRQQLAEAVASALK